MDSPRAQLIRNTIKRTCERTLLAEDVRNLTSFIEPLLGKDWSLPHNHKNVLSPSEQEALVRVQELLRQVDAALETLEFDVLNGEGHMQSAAMKANFKRRRADPDPIAVVPKRQRKASTPKA